MDDIIESTLYLKEIRSTPFSIIIKGDQKPVIYDIDHDVWRFALHHKRSPVWRTKNNTWEYGSIEDFKKIKNTLPIAKKYKKFSIPSQPGMNEFHTPIPGYIHYIWIGDKEIPEHVIENIINNSQQRKNYTSIIHVHSSTEEIFNNIKNQILNNEENIQVFNLKEENFFKNIKKTLGLKQYQPFFNNKNNIFASNILRYWIMYYYGGIFLDLRDSIVNDVSMMTLMAGPKDILLNIEEEIDLTKFSGYKNSSFTSQPYNPVLKNMMKILSEIYFKNEVFDIQFSPGLKKDDQGHLLNEEKINEYRENISRQVG